MFREDNTTRTRLVLLTLATGAFGIGTTEFAISGLMPGIAQDFDLSVTTVGWAATAYALGVFLGAPVMILLGQRFEKKKFLLVLMGLFVVGSLLTAFAPSFPVVLAGRVVSSLTHAAFIGIGSIIASRAVPAHRRTSAIAFMFSGMTLATLIGTPAATWVSTELSWRASFLGISAVGLIALFGVLTFIPTSTSDEAFAIAAEVRAFTNPQLLLAMLVTILGPAGFFTSITYISSITMGATGTPESWIPAYMIVFGLGLFLGNLAGGRLADENLMGLLLGSLVLLTLTLLAFWLFADNVAIAFAAVFLMAAAGFSTVSPIQRLVMERAEAAGAANLAASMNIGMFNLGNAIGAWLGGLVISAGLGDSSPNLAGALLAGGALLVGVLIWLQTKRSTMDAERELAHSR